jgi:hypothetical protein
MKVSIRTYPANKSVFCVSGKSSFLIKNPAASHTISSTISSESVGSDSKIRKNQ